ncbi:MAG: ABC transporter ATP-binding protein [Gemmatimonadales bacterium]
MSFELGDAWFRYPRSDKPALRGVSVDIPAGSHTAVVGPNGAGKTTLARLLLGTLRPQRGYALFEGRSAADWPRREMAKRIGVVAQGGTPALPVSVTGFVEMGRNPYVRPWAPLGEEDRAKVSDALRRTNLQDLASRVVNELSGGEVQRAKLARAFAQDPRVLVLDEPTAHLDVAHEMEIFRLVRDFVDDGGSAVTITHSLHLAGRFADRLCLLADGRLEAAGSPPEVLRSGTLSRVFDWPIEVVALDHAGLTGLHVVPVDRSRSPDRSEEPA